MRPKTAQHRRRQALADSVCAIRTGFSIRKAAVAKLGPNQLLFADEKQFAIRDSEQIALD